MDSSYAEVGTEVILISAYTNPVDWGIWVGQKARIIRPDRGSPTRRVVTVDGEELSWLIQNMILASDVPLLTPERRRYLRIRENG
jgi:hypothetical protein